MRIELRLGRPPTENKHRTLHPHARAKVDREWRDAGHLHAVAARRTWTAVPPVLVTATPHHRDRRSPQDAGACLPAVKAVLDGIVDGGFLPDDGPQWVAGILLRAPVIDGWDGLEMEVTTWH